MSKLSSQMRQDQMCLFEEDQGHQRALHDEAPGDCDDLEHVALHTGLGEQGGKTGPGQQHQIHCGHAIAESSEHCQQSGDGRGMYQDHGQKSQGLGRHGSDVCLEPGSDLFHVDVF